MNIKEKMKDLSDKDEAILKGIMSEAWQKYGDKLYTVKEVAPTVRKVADKALNEDAEMFTDAERGKIRAALATGVFDGTMKVEDPKVAKKYEKFVEKRIKQEIKKGNLTKPNEKSNKRPNKSSKGDASSK